MSNAEDYRRRFLERPKTLAEENAAKQREQDSARNSYQLSEANRITEFNQRKADIIRHQNTLLSDAYVVSGIKDRMIALASILSGGKVVESIEVKDETYKNDDKIKIHTLKIIKVPYLSFNGREIIQDDSLSEFSPGGRHSGPRTYYGQKLSENKILTSSLAVVLKTESFPSSPHYANVFNFQLHNETWKQEEMRWTKAWINKTGWVSRFEERRDYNLKYENGVVKGDYSDIPRLLDTSFDALYDSYLKVTKKI